MVPYGPGQVKGLGPTLGHVTDDQHTDPSGDQQGFDLPQGLLHKFEVCRQGMAVVQGPVHLSGGNPQEPEPDPVVKPVFDHFQIGGRRDHQVYGPRLQAGVEVADIQLVRFTPHHRGTLPVEPLEAAAGIGEHVQRQQPDMFLADEATDVAGAHAEGVGHVDAQINGIIPLAAVLAVENAENGGRDENILPAGAQGIPEIAELLQRARMEDGIDVLCRGDIGW